MSVKDGRRSLTWQIWKRWGFFLFGMTLAVLLGGKGLTLAEKICQGLDSKPQEAHLKAKLSSLSPALKGESHYSGTIVQSVGVMILSVLLLLEGFLPFATFRLRSSVIPRESRFQLGTLLYYQSLLFLVLQTAMPYLQLWKISKMITLSLICILYISPDTIRLRCNLQRFLYLFFLNWRNCNCRNRSFTVMFVG